MRIMDVPEFKDKTHVLTVLPDTPLDQVIAEMVSYNVGSAVVVKEGKLVGIFTERDLLVKVSGKKRPTESLKVSDVMTSNPHSAQLEDDVNISLRRMSQGRFRHLPIVDENKQVVGILSQGDFVAYTWSDLMARVGRHTKFSFLTNSQLWLLILGPLVYLILIKFLFFTG
ncbi:MAG: CBS domain-containing protein [Candidatus Paracaedibacteraceae bacterium]|nr:CBS domain-containing protein [Candidatus Paracaedibacteraceae bacterium]